MLKLLCWLGMQLEGAFGGKVWGLIDLYEPSDLGPQLLDDQVFLGQLNGAAIVTMISLSLSVLLGVLGCRVVAIRSMASVAF